MDRRCTKVEMDVLKPLCNYFPWVSNFFIERVYMSVYLGSSVDPHGALVDAGYPLRWPLSRDLSLRGRNAGR